MSEQATTTTAEELPPEEPTTDDTPQEEAPEPEAIEPEPEPDGDDSPDDPLSKVRAEAAKYRTRLREAEESRDTVTEQLANFQRDRIAELASGPGKLHDGADLFRDGTDLQELLKDDGTIDHDAVAGAIGTVQSKHPHWGAPADNGVRRRPEEKLKTGTGTTNEANPTWRQLLGKSAT